MDVCMCVQGWMCVSGCVHVHVRVSIYYSGLHINKNKTSL